MHSGAQAASVEQTAVQKLLVRVNDLEKRLVAAEEQLTKPKHLAELLFRVKGWPLWVLFTLCLLVQLGQIYLVNVALDADADVETHEIEEWIEDGILERRHNARNSCHPCDTVAILTAFRNNTISFTKNGWRISWHNMLVGVILVLYFQLAKLICIFFTYEYHIPGRHNICPAVTVLLGKIAVCVSVGLAASQSMVTSSLDSEKTIQAAIKLFFILGIDEIFLALAWELLRQYKNDAVMDGLFFIPLHAHAYIHLCLNTSTGIPVITCCF